MLFSLIKALASAVLLSAAAFGVAVDSSEHQLVKRAQPKGIDVSSNQGSINWKNVADKGISFAYIKATEGTGKSDGVIVVWCTDVLLQPTRILTSPPNILVPLASVLFVAATTLPALISLLGLLRPNISPPMVEAGVATVELSRAPLTSNVRTEDFQPQDPTTNIHNSSGR